MTQRELAQKLGYSNDALVSMWENGVRTPPTRKIPALAKALGCTLEELFEEEEEENARRKATAGSKNAG